MNVPTVVQEQYDEAMQAPDLTREEAERRFPELLGWILHHVSLADLVRDRGIALRPASPDAHGALVSHCPFCEETG